MNALTTPAAPQANASLAMLMDPQRFDHLLRVGKLLAASPLFPQHLSGGNTDKSLANAVLVLNMANRLNEDPLTVAQNIYFVGGRPGWNTTYCIAKANQHGVFKDPIDWEVKGKAESLSVTAFGVLRGTGKRVQITCDMEMAKKENWIKNPKYQSMPEQMLRYRSAAFLIRLYCPEVMVGVPAAVEVELEAKDVTPEGGPVVVEANDDAPIEAEATTVDTSAQDEAKAAAEAKEKWERAAKAKADEEARQAAAKEAERAKAEEAQRQSAARAAEAAQGQTQAQDPLDLREGTSATAAPADDPEVAERWEHLLQLMLDEINSGSSASDIEDVYGPQISQMRAQFPALAAKLDAALNNALTR